MDQTQNCGGVSHDARAGSGFTLVELSIVMVIIGLIAGGILVGRDLVKAAEVHSLISQLNSYDAAVYAFRGKYGYLPGDIPESQAAAFDLEPRGGNPGEGDGNGLIQGYDAELGAVFDQLQCGETVLFWNDLSKAGLIPGSFHGTANPCPIDIAGDALNNYLPSVKISGNFVYMAGNSYNVGATRKMGDSADGPVIYNDPGLSVQQAYMIDSKIDDGVPTRGKVSAFYVDGWLSGFIHSESTDSPSSCFNGTTNMYSMSQDGGNNINCAISYQMF